MDKLFGSNQAFSANLDMQVTEPSGQPVTMPGKIAYDMGKTRFEFNMADMKGRKMSPQGAAQMKAMGMDVMVTITRPDEKTAYLVYPGLQSYAATAMPVAESSPTNNDLKTQTTEIGKDTVDGHPCVENKVIITDKEGTSHESTVWNATDLKSFPVKIETTEEGSKVTMLFKNVSLAKPAAGEFEPPADFKKYDNIQQLMQEQMMKRMQNGGIPGMGPGAAHPPEQ